MSVHDSFMQRTFDLATSALVKGNHPFGAVLVHASEVVLTAENTVNTGGDQTRHAELNLIAEARRIHLREYLEECTLYASTAPCPMCAYATWESGITHIVYGVTYEKFAETITHNSSYIKIEDIYKLLKTQARIEGGVLEAEGVKVYKHWPKKVNHV